MNSGHFAALGGALCLFAGLGFSCVGADKLHEAQHASKKPVEITAAQLRSYRPGSNLHVTLTHFVPDQESILIYSTPGGHGFSVRVPILPADAPKGDRSEIVAIVHLSNVSDEAALERMLARSRWTGILHSRGDVSDAADIRRFNPGVNLERCWVMWEGHSPEDLSGAIPFVIVSPCVFVLGMVLAVVVALRPAASSAEGSFPPIAYMMFVPYFVFTALGDGVRWLHRHGLLTVHAAVLLAVVGLAAVGAAGYVLNRDWDNVAQVTGEMNFAIIGGLFGLGLLANAFLLGFVGQRFLPATPDSDSSQSAHDGKAPVGKDVRPIAVAVMVFGIIPLCSAGFGFAQGELSPRTYIVAALGSLALAAGAVWYLLLNKKSREKKAHIWNETGS